MCFASDAADWPCKTINPREYSVNDSNTHEHTLKGSESLF